MPYRVEKSQEKPMSPASFKYWLGSWQERGSVILLFLTLGIAVRSVEQAQWITPQPSLTLVLALAVLTGWLLYQSRLPDIARYFLAIVLGAMVVLWQASSLLPSLETASRVKQLIVALQSWWQAISMAQPSQGTIHFAIFLILFTWIIGYISTWFILRRQNAWVAVSLGAITILVNLSNLPERHYVFFFFYILAALLLVGLTSLARQHYWLKKSDITYPKRGIIYFMFSLLCLSLLAVSIAWLTPEVRANRLETVISDKMPWGKNIEEYFTNILAAVRAKRPFLKGSNQRELLFGDSSFDQGNELQFVIISQEPWYWRTRMYDVYTSSGWTSSDATEQVLMQGIPNPEADRSSERSQITYTVVTKLRTDIVLTAGEFISTNTPALVSLLTPLSFDIDSLNLPNTEETPMPPGRRDAVAVTMPHLLRPDERYTVTTSISLATPADLAEAGDDYPRWVTDYYLQLPPTLPERLRQVSEIITEGANSSYDKVLAIKRYLSLFDYSLETEAPPQGVDGVDYFLFTQESGNCVPFASTMAVMLRSVGVPSRLAIGYSPGEWDATAGRSILRAKNRHAWPEIYFPGYGWVGFEATPDIAGETEATPVVASEIDGGGEISEELLDIDFMDVLPGTGTTSRNRFAPTLVFIIIGIILLMFALWSAASRWFRNFTGLDLASEVYGKMYFLASLARLNPKPQQTPLEYSSELASVFPLQAEALDNITQAYIATRFSRRKELALLEKGRLQQSWRVVYPVLLKRLLLFRS